MKVGVVLVAAGRGTRMGGQDKAALAIGGQSALRHALVAFAPVVQTVIVVVAADRVAAWETIRTAEAWPVRTTIVPGGAARQESVRAGVDALANAGGCDVVVIHDGARPLVTTAMIRACIAVARRDGAAILAVPVTDTIKRVKDGRIIETADRTSLWAAQTPQVFRWQLLCDAFAWADALGGEPMTDEAALIELYGQPVAIVRGDRANIKLTEPDDLIVARALLEARMGQTDG
ncbi:MAG: 2-C-methyl-D-erythritol 4-phosphate cytidylyltransferase [Thermomicrobia bacterium]|nr:2-C-methyl-D-erythritol 4-phosphate cytidylyltransferase [Thermomicrobia bacterium]MCA1722797.1 2-C-methyl-D-erythritol 4-phosphate cytidylyltransferase [Thermomicrobia bacterium]